MNNYLLAHADKGMDTLSESLRFEAPETALYVRRRHHRQNPPLGGSSYGPPGSGRTSVLKFRVSGDEFLDPSTLCVKFTVENKNTAQPLIFVAPMWCVFSRLRVLVNGFTAEEVQDAHRTASLIAACSPRDGVYNNRAKQGFWMDAVGQNSDPTNEDENVRSFCVPLIASGIFNNEGNKFLPLKYLPQVDIELEIAPIDDFLLMLKPDTGTITSGVGANAAISASDIEIRNVKLFYDTIMLDSTVENSFYSHLEKGGTLDIPFSTWRNSRVQINNQTAFNVQALANVKSARSLYVSVIKQNAAPVGNADAATINAQLRTTGAAGMFYRHGIKDLDVQVGNLSFPDSPISDLAEFYHYLSVSMNAHHTYSNGLGITLTEYANDLTGLYNYSKNYGNASNIDVGPYPQALSVKNLSAATVAEGTSTDWRVDAVAAKNNYGSRFIVGFNLEKLLDKWMTGISLESEVVSVNCRNCSAAQNAAVSLMLHYNAVLRIGKNQIDVLERA
jgi:hypothetical protein